MTTRELIDAIQIAESHRIVAGRGEGSVWIEDEAGYRRIEGVYDADGGVYIRLIPGEVGAMRNPKQGG